MKTPKKPAGAKCTAETAELRKVQPDRPERKQRRGTDAGKVNSESCGKTAEKLRNLSPSSVSPPESGVLPPSAPTLVKRRSVAKRREEAPSAAPAVRGDGWPLVKVSKPVPQRFCGELASRVMTHSAELNKSPVP